jgi:hypothetical protein
MTNATQPARAGEMLTVISLWQPYASLMFTKERHKRHETRGFKLPSRLVGQWVGIHATATFPPLAKISERLHELCLDVWGCGYNFSLPQGAVLGAVLFDRCQPTDTCSPFNEDDETAGDWAAGRYAWFAADVVALARPFAAKGKQGWWSVPLPSELAALTPGGGRE